MFRKFDSETDDTDYPDVPDPWYGNLAGFERVFEMVSRTCLEFADHLERAHSD
jgi:protein-tyrosine-phosphatase